MHKRSKTKTTAALGVFANATLPFDKKLKRKTASVGKARLAKIPKKKEKSLLTLNMAQTAGAEAFNIASDVNGESPNGRNTKLTTTLNEQKFHNTATSPDNLKVSLDSEKPTLTI